MQRITGATVSADLHGTGKDGFTEGVPGTTPATIITDDWLNGVQEEILTVIENASINPSSANNAQLYEGVIAAAGYRYIGGAVASHVSRTSPSAIDFYKVAYGFGDSIFVAVGSTALGPTTSPDGVTWTNRSAGDYNNVCEGSGRFLVVGDSGTMATSDNGTSYTARTPDAAFAGHFYSCHHGGSYYVAAGASGEIQTATDAITWTHRALASPGTVTFFAGAYGSGVHVIVGGASPNLPIVETASNASIGTWTAQTPSELTGTLYGVAYGGGVFVAVGEGPGSGDTLIMRSADLGVTWETIDAPNNIASALGCVAYDSDHQVFVACGNDGTIIISRDGSNGSWRDLSRASFTSVLGGLAFGDGTCVLVGNGSALRQSLAFPWME